MKLSCFEANYPKNNILLMIDSPTDRVKKLVATELITKVVDMINVYSKQENGIPTDSN